MPTTMVSMRFPDELKRGLDAYCFATGVTQTEAVIQGLRRLLSDAQRAPELAVRMNAALDAMPPR